jgi:hypothetical protein
MKKENIEEIKKELNYSELEDRLEMAQIAAADTIRCNNESNSVN